MPRSARILYRQDLRERKGIRASRQRLHELIRKKLFPPPDGRTTDSKRAPPWWFERTIDRHLQERAAAERRRRAKLAEPMGSAGGRQA
jgi:hypothetical protein